MTFSPLSLRLFSFFFELRHFSMPVFRFLSIISCRCAAEILPLPSFIFADTLRFLFALMSPCLLLADIVKTLLLRYFAFFYFSLRRFRLMSFFAASRLRERLRLHFAAGCHFAAIAFAIDADFRCCCCCIRLFCRAMLAMLMPSPLRYAAFISFFLFFFF